MISAELQEQRKQAIALSEAGLRLPKGFCSPLKPSLPGTTDLSNGGGISHGAGYRAPAKPKDRCEKTETNMSLESGGKIYFNFTLQTWRVRDGYPVDERDFSSSDFMALERRTHSSCRRCGKVTKCECNDRLSSLPVPDNCKAVIENIKELQNYVPETQHSSLPDKCFVFTSGTSPERFKGPTTDASLRPNRPTDMSFAEEWITLQAKKEQLVQHYYHKVDQKGLRPASMEVHFSPYMWKRNLENAEHRKEKPALPLLGGSSVWNEVWPKEGLEKRYATLLEKTAAEVGKNKQGPCVVSYKLAQSDLSEWCRLNYLQRVLPTIGRSGYKFVPATEPAPQPDGPIRWGWNERVYRGIAEPVVLEVPSMCSESYAPYRSGTHTSTIADVNEWIESMSNPKAIECGRLIKNPAWREEGFQETYRNDGWALGDRAMHHLVFFNKQRPAIKPEKSFIAGNKTFAVFFHGKPLTEKCATRSFHHYVKRVGKPLASLTERQFPAAVRTKWSIVSSWNSEPSLHEANVGDIVGHNVGNLPVRKGHGLCDDLCDRHKPEEGFITECYPTLCKPPTSPVLKCNGGCGLNRWTKGVKGYPVWTQHKFHPTLCPINNAPKFTVSKDLNTTIVQGDPNPYIAKHKWHFSAGVRKFMHALNGAKENLKNPDKPTLVQRGERLNWVVKLKKGGQLTLSEEGLIRDRQHEKLNTARRATQNASWTAARTHCNLAYRDFKVKADESTNQKEWEENIQQAHDWYAKATVCEVAGGTVKDGFELEPSGHDVMGRTRAYQSENFIPDSTDTGDDSADALETFLGMADEDHSLDAEQEFPATYTSEEIEAGMTFLKPRSDSPDEGEAVIDAAEIDTDEEDE